MISFTDAAKDHLATALEENEMVRVAVQGGGCSGMNYILNIETEYDEEDISNNNSNNIRGKNGKNGKGKGKGKK